MNETSAQLLADAIHHLASAIYALAAAETDLETSDEIPFQTLDDAGEL